MSLQKELVKKNKDAVGGDPPATHSSVRLGV